jgi:rhamnogalacturonyl hydrolase YesR
LFRAGGFIAGHAELLERIRREGESTIKMNRDESELIPRLPATLPRGHRLQTLRFCGLLAIGLLSGASFLAAQAKAAPPARQQNVGDAPAVAPPLATDLSGKLTHRDVRRAIRKVGDWQLERAEPNFDQDWTYAALYAGFMAVPDGAGGKRYRDAMVRMGKKFDWQPGPRVEHADDQAIGQTYLDLYARSHDAAMLGPIRARMDAEMKTPDDPAKPLWWWCDALFLEPPVLAKLAHVTGDRKYLDFMDREWWITSALLYDPAVHLYYRDATFLGKRQANGKGLFWSRGNGWVMAGLARVLAAMPADYPTRAKYVAQFQEMAAEIASIQSSDGLWRPGLLDASAYPLPENSGSGFDIYALAYGVNNGLLDRAKYMPMIEKGWAGLVSHIYADGRLGCIQPIGAAPGDYPADASYVFGTGAFLLAGSEVDRLAK